MYLEPDPAPLTMLWFELDCCKTTMLETDVQESVQKKGWQGEAITAISKREVMMKLKLEPPAKGADYTQGEILRGTWIVDVPKELFVTLGTVHLDCVTSGEDEHVVQRAAYTLKRHTFEPGTNEIAFELEVPLDAPVSWEGEHVEVSWQVRASLGLSTAEGGAPPVMKGIRVTRSQEPIAKKLLEKYAAYTPLLDASLLAKIKLSLLMGFIGLVMTLFGVMSLGLFIYTGDWDIEIIALAACTPLLIVPGVMMLWSAITGAMADIIFDENTLTCTPAVCKAGQPFSFKVSCRSRMDIEVTDVRVVLLGYASSRFWGETLDHEGDRRDAIVAKMEKLTEQPLEWTGKKPLHIERGEDITLDLPGELAASLPSSFKVGDLSDELYNEVRWHMNIELDIPRWPDVSWSIPIEVL